MDLTPMYFCGEHKKDVTSAFLFAIIGIEELANKILKNDTSIGKSRNKKDIKRVPAYRKSTNTGGTGKHTKEKELNRDGKGSGKVRNKNKV
jgi:hypothetical protein